MKKSTKSVKVKASMAPMPVETIEQTVNIKVIFTGNLFHAIEQNAKGIWTRMDFIENHNFSLASVVAGVLKVRKHVLLDLHLVENIVVGKAA